MMPIAFYPVPRMTIDTICKNSPLDPEFLAKYLSVRPDVLDQATQDIFAPNSRSVNQQWKDFSLFYLTQKWQDAQVIVFQQWMELFEAGDVRQNIAKAIKLLPVMFPGKLYVISWNHDRDAATVPELQNLPDSFLVIQYNTSRPTHNDILVPFWTINTNPPRVLKKQWLAGFHGYVGSLLTRRKLAQIFRYRNDSPSPDNGYYFGRDRIEESDWLRLVSSFKFSLCPRGGGLSSYRFFESMHCGAIPVLFADDAKLPFANLTDYAAFSLRLPESAAGSFKAIDDALRSADYARMLQRLEDVRPLFSLRGVQQAVSSRIREQLK